MLSTKRPNIHNTQQPLQLSFESHNCTHMFTCIHTIKVHAHIYIRYKICVTVFFVVWLRKKRVITVRKWIISPTIHIITFVLRSDMNSQVVIHVLYNRMINIQLYVHKRDYVYFFPCLISQFDWKLYVCT